MINDEDFPEEASLDLGPCCACGESGPHVRPTIRNIMMLDRLCPTPGRGWGCVACNLPLDYAIAVLCDACLEAKAEIKFVCTGFPAGDGRTPIELAPLVKVKHNPLYHPEMLQEMTWFDDSPDYGDSDCFCSLCGDLIAQWPEDDDAPGPLRLFREKSQAHPHGQEARFCPDCVPAVLKYCSTRAKPERKNNEDP